MNHFDDGAGLHRNRIKQKAKELALTPPAQSGEEVYEHWLKQIIFAADQNAALPAADALVIVTEWKSFRAADLNQGGALLLCTRRGRVQVKKHTARAHVPRGLLRHNQRAGRGDG